MSHARTGRFISYIMIKWLTVDGTSSTIPVGLSKGGTHGVVKQQLSETLPLAKLRLCPLCVPKMNNNKACSRDHPKKVYQDDSKEKFWSSAPPNSHILNSS